MFRSGTGLRTSADEARGCVELGATPVGSGGKELRVLSSESTIPVNLTAMHLKIAQRTTESIVNVIL